jgi:hypothetical protein
MLYGLFEFMLALDEGLPIWRDGEFYVELPGVSCELKKQT